MHRLSHGFCVVAVGCWVAFAQCNMNDQSSCPVTANTPDVGPYLAYLNTALQTINTISMRTPRPKIPLVMSVMPASNVWMQNQPTCDPAKPGNCTWDDLTGINNYSDILIAGGANVLSSNVWITPLKESAEYQSLCGASGGVTGADICLAPSQASSAPSTSCADTATTTGGSGMGIAFPAPISGSHCQKSLAVLDQWIQHLAAKGLKLRIRPKPDPAMVSICPITSAANAVSYVECMAPLEVAAIKRWGPYLDSMSIVHEPRGGLAGALGFNVPVSTVDTLIQDVSNAVRGFNTTITLGADLSGASYTATDMGGGSNFLAAWTTTDKNYLNYVGGDVYSGSCDVTRYPVELLDATGNAVMNGSPGWAYAFKQVAAAGLHTRISESARTVWCTCAGGTGCADGNSGENNAIWGCGDITWQSSGAETAWRTAFITWAQSLPAIDSVHIYNAQPVVAHTTDHTNDNCQNPLWPSLIMTSPPMLADKLMDQVGMDSAASVGGQAVATWGKVAVTGKVKLGQQ